MHTGKYVLYYLRETSHVDPVKNWFGWNALPERFCFAFFFIVARPIFGWFTQYQSKQKNCSGKCTYRICYWTESMIGECFLNELQILWISDEI